MTRLMARCVVASGGRVLAHSAAALIGLWFEVKNQLTRGRLPPPYFFAALGHYGVTGPVSRDFTMECLPRGRRQIISIFQGGGRGRTRTYEGVSQRIYSPPPLPLGTLSRTSRLGLPMT